MTTPPILARTATLAISLLIAGLAAHAQGISEFQVKALFIYNFAKFVDWPPDAFSSPHDAMNICIAGDDPFGSDIDQALKGKTINSRELLIRRIARNEDPKSCQVLFFGAQDKKSTKQLAAAVVPLPVLTVGETESSANFGVVIAFVMDGSKVRFDVNLEASKLARLKISSKLLTLARTVKGSRK